MKHINILVLAALLGAASVAMANPPLVDDSIHNSANGGSASNHTDVDVNTSVHNSATAGSASSARQDQGQVQGQSEKQGQAQGISAFNGNTTTVEAPDVKGMGKELAKHADSAARSESSSSAQMSPCGDATGLSAQAGLGGVGFATTSETCKAFRLQVLEAMSEKGAPVSTTLAEITYFVGWPFRTVLHVASFGVLN